MKESISKERIINLLKKMRDTEYGVADIVSNPELAEYCRNKASMMSSIIYLLEDDEYFKLIEANYKEVR